MAPNPKIRRRFNTQEPTKLPIAKSVSFLIMATIEVTSSGEAVPMAIMVEPITASERPKSSAILTAESTTKSLPYFNSTIPKTKKKTDKSVLFKSEAKRS